MWVDELIEVVGSEIVLKKLAPEQPNFDELRGEWIGEPVYETTPIKALVRPLKALERQSVAGLENEEAVKVITTARVEIGDRVEIAGKTYKVEQIRKIFRGQKVLYTEAICVEG